MFKQIIAEILLIIKHVLYKIPIDRKGIMEDGVRYDKYVSTWP